MDQATAQTPSRGQSRMGVSFNPSQREDIVKIKQAYADLFDLVEKLAGEYFINMTTVVDENTKSVDGSRAQDAGRALSLSKTKLQESKMWAIEAITR